MKNRLLCLFLALLMLLAAIPAAQAADFYDTQNHWAKDYIDEVSALGLFGGVSETSFDPDGTMTRGMFVTVLGRLEAVDPVFWSSDAVPHFFKQDVDENAYYAPYVYWAVCNGIVDGMSPTNFAPDAPVTREQVAKLVASYVLMMDYGLLMNPDDITIPDSFADEDDISPWAHESVDIMRTVGILNGSLNSEGELCFLPQKSLTRAECATIFSRLHRALVRHDGDPIYPAAITLNKQDVSLDIGQTMQLIATVTPQEASLTNLVWRSSDPYVISVDQYGMATCLAEGTAEVSVYTPNGLYASCTFRCEKDLASADETYEEKCIRLFGEVVDNPKYYYAVYDENGNYVGMDYERAKADMVSITVDVWDIGSNGQKYTRKFTIDVHKNLKDTYIQIFKEIYEGEERFPIHYLCSYSQSGRSEHTLGTAVDINPNENYYYNSITGEQVGDYWKPGEDPYSIPLDGEVARIFAKYGFSQGIWTNTVDYMHFSYFGT